MGALAKKYPDYEIRGAILSIDLGDGNLEFFNSYKPNECLFDGLVKRAETIWQWYLQTKNEEQVRMDLDPGPLCGFCSAIRTCPIFENIKDYPAEGMDEYIQEFNDCLIKETNAKNTVKSHKKAILKVVQIKGPFQAGGLILQAKTLKRKDLDKARLSTFLAENGSSLSEFETISESKPFLDIKAVKSTQRKAA